MASKRGETSFPQMWPTTARLFCIQKKKKGEKEREKKKEKKKREKEKEKGKKGKEEKEPILEVSGAERTAETFMEMFSRREGSE